MYCRKKDTRVEVVRIKDIARRLDLMPLHLATIVLLKLQVHPVQLNDDQETDWYFWSDVVKALQSVSRN